MSTAIATQKHEIDGLLKSVEIADRFKRVAPPEVDADRMLTVCKLALQRVPNLKTCDPWSVLGAMLSCVSLGLEPASPLKHAYLIPYGNTLTFIISFPGYLTLLDRTARVRTVQADVWREGEHFLVERGTNARFEHRPTFTDAPILGAYSYVHLIGEEHGRPHVVPISRINEVMKRSQAFKKGNSPWHNDFAQMAVKHALNTHAKTLPLSPQLARARELDSLAEVGRVNFAAIGQAEDTAAALDVIPETEPPAEKPTLKDRLAGANDAAIDVQPDPTPTAEELFRE